MGSSFLLNLGEKGIKGERGEPGIGERGEKGPPGPIGNNLFSVSTFNIGHRLTPHNAPQVQLVYPGTAKMEVQDKREPRVSRETLALMASLDPQGLRVSVTRASVPIMPVWHKDPTPKMSRELKESPAVFMNFAGPNGELSQDKLRVPD